MIAIISVRHSGTRFVRDELLKKQCLNAHVGEKQIYLDVLLPYFNNLIIPLRRPERIIVSWERRGMELDGLSDCLSILMAYDRYDPMYFPIDAPDRQGYLDKINQRLGLELKTDWPVISDKHSSEATWDDVTDKVMGASIIDDFAPFFNRFYGR